MTLNGVMAVTLRYSTEFGKSALQKTIVAEFMQESIAFLVHVQCRRKESSCSLSHLLMSLLSTANNWRAACISPVSVISREP